MKQQEAEAYTHGLKDRILLLNNLSLIGFSFFLLIDTLLTISTDVHSTYYGLIRLAVIVGILGLNYLLRARLSSRALALLLIMAYYLGFIVYPLLPIPVRLVENFFLLYMLLLVVSLLPYLVFHIVKDRTFMIGMGVFIFISAAIGTGYMLERMAPEDQQQLLTYLDENPMVWLTYMACMGFLQFVLYRYRRHNYLLRWRLYEASASLDARIGEIQRSSQELINQQELLIDLQLELSDLQQNLESTIQERTEGLRSRQKMMIHYGFMNSHLLRAPIARLMGLLQVLHLDLPDSEKEELGHLVIASIDEIDNVSVTINDALQNPSTDKLAEVERRVSQLYGTGLDME